MDLNIRNFDEGLIKKIRIIVALQDTSIRDWVIGALRIHIEEYEKFIRPLDRFLESTPDEKA